MYFYPARDEWLISDDLGGLTWSWRAAQAVPWPSRITVRWQVSMAIYNEGEEICVFYLLVSTTLHDELLLAFEMCAPPACNATIVLACLPFT
jgi:hypothetical protein